jgi:hypothetical protein
MEGLVILTNALTAINVGYDTKTEGVELHKPLTLMQQDKLSDELAKVMSRSHFRIYCNYSPVGSTNSLKLTIKLK